VYKGCTMNEMTAEKVRNTRNRMEMTREEFAKRIGVSPWTVISWELGRRTCRGLYAKAIKEASHA